jgi:Immunity protein 22
MKKNDHSDEFKRLLVDEALNRTPRGGFPELEARHGLKPGTLFDWVKAYGPPSPPAPFSALHFWIGTTPLSDEDFGAYFDAADDYWSHEVEDIETSDSDLTGCGFCVDLGMRFLYDEDLLLVIRLDAPVAVRELVDMSALPTDKAVATVVAACTERGIHTANAMFVYGDPTQPVPNAAKLYNGLTYVGLFQSKAGKK